MKAKKFETLKGDGPMEKLTSFRHGSIGRVIYVQEKFNGIHCTVRIAPGQPARFYTKPSAEWPDGKQWPDSFFRDIFDQFNVLHPVTDVTFFGELIIDGMSLQELAGQVAVNRTELGPIAKTNVKIILYDMFIDKELIVNQPFSQRLRMLRSFFPSNTARVQVAYTLTTADIEEAERQFHLHLSLGREGVIYRGEPCYYIKGTECWQLIKRKRCHDMEGVIVSVNEGKGKHAGMLGAFVVKLPSGVTVKVGRGLGMTEKLMTKLYRDRLWCIGQPLTFSYEEMSKAGIPLRNQFVAIRNYES